MSFRTHSRRQRAAERLLAAIDRYSWEMHLCPTGFQESLREVDRARFWAKAWNKAHARRLPID